MDFHGYSNIVHIIHRCILNYQILHCFNHKSFDFNRIHYYINLSNIQIAIHHNCSIQLHRYSCVQLFHFYNRFEYFDHYTFLIVVHTNISCIM